MKSADYLHHEALGNTIDELFYEECRKRGIDPVLALRAPLDILAIENAKKYPVDEVVLNLWKAGLRRKEIVLLVKGQTDGKIGQILNRARKWGDPRAVFRHLTLTERTVKQRERHHRIVSNPPEAPPCETSRPFERGPTSAS